MRKKCWHAAVAVASIDAASAFLSRFGGYRCGRVLEETTDFAGYFGIGDSGGRQEVRAGLPTVRWCRRQARIVKVEVPGELGRQGNSLRQILPKKSQRGPGYDRRNHEA